MAVKKKDPAKPVLDVKEIERAHAASAKEVDAREASKRKRDEILAREGLKNKKALGKRLDGILKNDMVEVKVLDSALPVVPDPISAVAIPGLIELSIKDTHLRLLGMLDPNEVPNMQQRVAMAKRLLEVGPFLPKYVASIQLKPKAVGFDKAAIEESRALAADREKAKKEKAAREAAERADSAKRHERREDRKPDWKKKQEAGEPSRTGVVKKMIAAPSDPNAVPLKKVCAEINIDPRIARRILRSSGSKPGGRWEWAKDKVAEVQALLQKERGKYENKGG